MMPPYGSPYEDSLARAFREQERQRRMIEEAMQPTRAFIDMDKVLGATRAVEEYARQVQREREQLDVARGMTLGIESQLAELRRNDAQRRAISSDLSSFMDGIQPTIRQFADPGYDLRAAREMMDTVIPNDWRTGLRSSTGLDLAEFVTARALFAASKTTPVLEEEDEEAMERAGEVEDATDGIAPGSAGETEGGEYEPAIIDMPLAEQVRAAVDDAEMQVEAAVAADPELRLRVGPLFLGIVVMNLRSVLSAVDALGISGADYDRILNTLAFVVAVLSLRFAFLARQDSQSDRADAEQPPR